MPEEKTVKSKNNIQDTVVTLEKVVLSLQEVIKYLKTAREEAKPTTTYESAEYDELPEDIRAMIR